MANVSVSTKRMSRVSQGDVFREVELIESVREHRGVITVEKVVFPLVVVLTQDCDLQQDNHNRSTEQETHGNRILSVLVAPLYNFEHVIEGSHLSELKLKVDKNQFQSSKKEVLKQNRNPRYHYIDFPAEIPLVSGVVDFKHYFSVQAEYLERVRRKNFVCRLGDLFREDVSQRFAAFLSRIGLPNI